MNTHQPLEFLSQVAQDHRRGLGPVLGYQAHQEAPTGLLQLRGCFHAGSVRGPVALVVVEVVIAYAVAWLWIARRLEDPVISIGALAAVFIGEFTLLGVAALPEPTSLVLLTSAQLSMLLEGIDWRRPERTAPREIDPKPPTLAA